jgi:hypothetical protein
LVLFTRIREGVFPETRLPEMPILGNRASDNGHLLGNAELGSREGGGLGLYITAPVRYTQEEKVFFLIGLLILLNPPPSLVAAGLLERY